MTSTKEATVRTGSLDPAALRRSGWQLIASFVAFVIAVAMMILFQPDYNRALDEAAKERGVILNDLPAEAIAPINHEYNVLWQGALFLAVILLSLGLFAAGLRGVARLRPGGVAVGTVAVAGVMPACWIGVMLLEWGIGTDSPGRWVGAYDALMDPFIAASTVAGSLAVVGLAVVLRRAGIARRTGLVVSALAGLLIVAAILAGAPPIVPLLLGAVVGIVMIRTARSH